jgi:hypothetical protein
VAVRSVEAADRVATHHEADELALVDQVRAACTHAFIVEPIEAVDLHAVQRRDRRIVIDRQPLGRDVLVDVRRERLAAGLVLLAMAFDAVTEHLVEEHARCPTLEDRGPDVRLRER